MLAPPTTVTLKTFALVQVKIFLQWLAYTTVQPSLGMCSIAALPLHEPHTET